MSRLSLKLISSVLSCQSGQEYPSLSTSPLQLTPVLVDSQIQRIAETASELAKNLPPFVEPKQPHNKKKINKELEVRWTLVMVDN